MLKQFQRFMFGYKYFSAAEYQREGDDMAAEVASRPCRGNTSVQLKRMVTERDLVAEARAPICGDAAALAARALPASGTAYDNEGNSYPAMKTWMIPIREAEDTNSSLWVVSWGPRTVFDEFPQGD